MDDLRLLIGKSRFYKGEYVLARHNFQFIIKEFPDSKLLPEVYTWLVATYYMNNMESTAEKVLAEKVSQLKLKKKHKGQLAMLKTSIQIEQEEYGLAIKTLEKDLKNIKGVHNKARAHFLLGQLYADRDKFSKSYEYFHKVSKMNTDYELIFNAKMQIARLYIDKEDGEVDNRKVMKLLKKMLRDEKNFDYADQIYYQMGLLELKNNDEQRALELLKESVAQETGSQRQKSLSYYKIGQIYFYNQENYDMAEVYFDSAASFISNKDPEYDEITSINKTLKEYVGHVRTIHYQDSMVKLYEMDSVSLARYIDNLIAEEKRKAAEEEAKRREEEESEAANNPRFDPFNNGGFQTQGGSGFYFDSPEGISAGKTDFQRIWGRRKNEDNWRRKNKAIQLAAAEEGEDSTGDGYDDPLKEIYGDKYAWYKDIPKNEKELAEANKKIEEALLGLGQVFRDNLNQPEKAIETFETLIRRYPKSEHAPKAYYALFRLYEDLDPYRADDYKEYICETWPKSKYCKLANNQDVGEDAKQAKDECKSAYNALYQTYKAEDYGTVISFADFNIGRFETCSLLPNMYYLKGMSYGYMKNLDSLKSVFLLIRDNFPEADITPTVIQTLAKMGVNTKVAANPKEEETVEGNPNDGKLERNDARFMGFSENPKPNENFYVLYFVNKETISTNELKIKIQDFNKQYFKDKNLTTSIFFYKKVQHIGYISQFKKVQDALSYIKSAESDTNIEDVLQNEGERIVFITPTNFKTAYGKRRFADYFLFYDNFILPSLDQ